MKVLLSEIKYYLLAYLLTCRSIVRFCSALLGKVVDSLAPSITAILVRGKQASYYIEFVSFYYYYYGYFILKTHICWCMNEQLIRAFAKCQPYIIFTFHEYSPSLNADECPALSVPREPRRDQSDRRLYEHGMCIRHYQDSNLQSVLSQTRADSSRPQWSE